MKLQGEVCRERAALGKEGRQLVDLYVPVREPCARHQLVPLLYSFDARSQIRTTGNMFHSPLLCSFKESELTRYVGSFFSS